MSLVLFVLFSVIEFLALFYLCCSIFRFKANTYLLKFIIVQILIIIGNYYIRQEEAFSNFAPPFSMIMFILCIRIFLEEVSLFWAAVMGMISTMILGITQGLIILLLLNTTSFTTYADIQNNTIGSYVVQSLTALIIILPAQYLYKRGVGFTFNVDRFKLVGESIVILFILFASLITVGIIFFTNNLILITIILLIPLIYLIYFSIKKQKEDVANTSFLE